MAWRGFNPPPSLPPPSPVLEIKTFFAQNAHDWGNSTWENTLEGFKAYRLLMFLENWYSVLEEPQRFNVYRGNP